MTDSTKKPAPSHVDIDELAQEIRRVDGAHALGAGALSEALAPYIAQQIDMHIAAVREEAQCRTCALMPSRPDILFQSLVSSVQSFVARQEAGDAPAAREWRRHVQLYAQALAGVDHAAAPADPWKPIAELPNSDDLFWFMRWDDAAHTSYTVDGPRPPLAGGFDADEWAYFARAESPCVRTLTKKTTLQERITQHLESGDGFLGLPELRRSSGKTSFGLYLPTVAREMSMAEAERAAVPETDTPVEAVYPVPENADESESLEPGPWMQGDMKPVREGRYLRHFDDQDEEAYSEWRAGKWYVGEFLSPISDVQNAPWRGGVLVEGKTHADWVSEHGIGDDE